MHRIDPPSTQFKPMLVERSHPSLPELKERVELSTNMMGFASTLLSQSINIIKEFELFQKVPDEPAQPYLFQAELVNHHRLKDDELRYLRSSGKGMTPVEAQMGALGEGVESYSALSWYPDEIRFARRAELEAESVAPNKLGLYLPEQYAELSYTPYTDDSIVG
ncbi:MAG: YcaO-like family protein, partial [Anaerolineae bacterium]|nr:YcaO-like family protein [Anaerolineae bacterium]